MRYPCVLLERKRTPEGSPKKKGRLKLFHEKKVYVLRTDFKKVRILRKISRGVPWDERTLLGEYIMREDSMR